MDVLKHGDKANRQFASCQFISVLLLQKNKKIIALQSTPVFWHTLYYIKLNGWIILHNLICVFYSAICCHVIFLLFLHAVSLSPVIINKSLVR